MNYLCREEKRKVKKKKVLLPNILYKNHYFYFLRGLTVHFIHKIDNYFINRSRMLKDLNMYPCEPKLASDLMGKATKTRIGYLN